LPATSGVAAAPQGVERRVQITFEDMGYPVMKAVGAQSTVSYLLVIPEAWQRPGHLRVTLDISHSGLLLPSRSVVTVAFNDVPLKTFRLDETNQEHGLLMVDLPLSDPRPKNYKLDVIFYMRVSYDECRDLQSPALWALVHETSFVEFTFEEGAERYDLQYYPYPLMPARTVVPSAVHFVLPPQPAPVDLEAAARISAKLGQLAGTDLVQITAGSWDDAPPGSSLIVIGQPAMQPVIAMLNHALPVPLHEDGRSFVYPSGPPITSIPSDWGVVQLLPHPNDPDRPVLVVSGGDTIGLQRAALALASQANLNLMKGNYVLIPDVQPGSDVFYHIPGQAHDRVTLADLTGHTEDWTVRGVGISSLAFQFNLPGDWEMRDSGYVDLQIAHSPTLWAERSMLEVYLNGRLLHVELLTPENAMPSTVHVNLPAKLIRPGSNLLSLRFTLNLRMEQCVREFLQDVWAQVFSDSELVLPHDVVPLQEYTPELADYPYPFNDNPTLENTWVLLPDAPSSAELTAALQIIARIGRGSTSKELRPHMTFASQVPPEQRADRHLIVISVGDRNPLMAELSHRLRVAGQSLKSLSTYVGQPIITTWDAFPVGVVEAMASPWDKAHALWVVFGTNEEAIDLAAQALSFGETADELGGDLAVFTSSTLEGGAVTLFTTLPTPTPLPQDQVPVEQAPEVPAPLTWFFGSLVVIVGALAIFVLAQDRRARHKEKE